MLIAFLWSFANVYSKAKRIIPLFVCNYVRLYQYKAHYKSMKDLFIC